MTRFNEQKHFPRRNVNQFGLLLYLESNDLIVELGHGQVETERVQQVRRHHWVVDDEDNWSTQELETMLAGSGVSAVVLCSWIRAGEQQIETLLRYKTWLVVTDHQPRFEASNEV